MANYSGMFRTNYFMVNDDEKFKEIINQYSAEGKITVSAKIGEDNVTRYCFYCEGCLYGIPSKDGEPDEDELGRFLDALQSVIDKEDAIIIIEIGNENLRYLVGDGTIITHNKIECVSLTEMVLAKTKQMLENENYNTQMDY